MVNGLQSLFIVYKALHLTCLQESWLRLCEVSFEITLNSLSCSLLLQELELQLQNI